MRMQEGGQHSGRANVLKALFVWEPRGSAQLSISLSQVTVSRVKVLLRHKAAPGPSGRV